MLPIEAFEGQLPELKALLKILVETESPTTDKAMVDRLGDRLEQELLGLGAELRRLPQTEVGDHLLATWNPGEGGVLLLAHMDTVHPAGSLERMPWLECDGMLRGPGIFDMKASLAMALIAMRALLEARAPIGHRVTLLCTSDEETGSRTSRQLIEDQARQHDLVLCLEPPLGDGSLKTWRKGVGTFWVEVEGRATHAGVSPQNGVNAILEMSRQIERISALADEQSGTSINVGVVRGGTRTNVVPEHCLAKVDVRILSTEERARVAAAMQGLTPTLEGARIKVRSDWNRPPMPRTESIGRAFAWAKHIGRQLGLELDEGGTGGASDANFVAPLGVALLDGLGAVGGEAHSPREFVRADSLAPRTALLAALISRADGGPLQDLE